MVSELKNINKNIKMFIRIATIIGLICLNSLPSLAAQFKLTRIYDGDTVMAETAGSIIYIMLVGVDAPEVTWGDDPRGQPFGKEAKDFLVDLILNRTVEVEGYGTAPYPDNNIIGVIHLNSTNINLELVRNGLAEVHRDSLPDGFGIEPYLSAENEAREAKKGMWILGGEYISPKEWRKKYR